jgi:hypothetical protein
MSMEKKEKIKRKKRSGKKDMRGNESSERKK